MRFASKLPKTQVVDREAFILSNCRGKKVLHLGCVDSGLLTERLSSGRFLHAALATVSSELWGLDVDLKGIERLRHEGFERVHVGSAETMPADIPRAYFDVVLAGELLEHVSNPGLLLESAAACCSPSGGLLLTTPNGLRFSNVISGLISTEMVHPDHTLAFTPATLQRLLKHHNLDATSLFLCQDSGELRIDNARTSWERLLRLAYNILLRPGLRILLIPFPYFADGLIVVAKRRSNSL